MHWASASAETRIDRWAAELESVRREVVAARRSLADVHRHAGDIATVTAWVSPAMAAFRERLRVWSGDLARQDYPLQRFDDALAEAHRWVLLDGAGIRP